MELQKITRIRKILELIVFSVILLALLHSFSCITIIRKIKGNNKALKVYYLMDFRLLDGRYLNKGYAITQISTDDFICDHLCLPLAPVYRLDFLARGRACGQEI